MTDTGAGAYVRFRERPLIDRKTRLWVVESIHGAILGEIAWFGRWRQYTFNPIALTTFSWGCLADIGAFCREQSRLQLQRARTLAALKESKGATQ